MYGVNIGVEFTIESLDDINYRHAFGCDAVAIFESSRCMVFQHGCVCFSYTRIIEACSEG